MLNSATRGSRVIGFMMAFGTTVVALVLGGAVTQSASAATDLAFRNCQVDLLAPSGAFQGGAVNANGRFVSNGGCGNATVTICLDPMYKNNNGVWGSWNSASPSDSFNNQRNGCSRYHGTPAGEGGFSVGLAWTWQPHNCSDFQGVQVRSSVWIEKDGLRSEVRRGGQYFSAFC